MRIKKNIHPRIKLSTLWIVVLFNMIFADIFSIMIELVKGNTLNFPGDVKTIMAIAAIVTNIPILMIFLSWILPYKSNRMANYIAGIVTILYILGGGSLSLHYIIIAVIEISAIVMIIAIFSQWSDPEIS